jgi:hypothetical protein
MDDIILKHMSSLAATRDLVLQTYLYVSFLIVRCQNYELLKIVLKKIISIQGVRVTELAEQSAKKPITKDLKGEEYYRMYCKVQLPTGTTRPYVSNDRYVKGEIPSLCRNCYSQNARPIFLEI